MAVWSDESREPLILLPTTPLLFMFGFNGNQQCCIDSTTSIEPIASLSAPTTSLSSSTATLSPSNSAALLQQLPMLSAGQVDVSTAPSPSNSNPSGASSSSSAPPSIIPSPQLVRFFLHRPDITLVTTGGNHSMVMTRDGALWVFGANSDGQLGLGHYDQVSQPVELKFFQERGERVRNLYCGYNFSLIVTTNTNDSSGGTLNSLWSTGYNSFGQGALGSTTLNVHTPQRVEFITENRIRIRDIAAGGNHVLMLTEDNQVYSWGYGRYGQTGLGNQSNHSIPQLITFFDASRPVIGISAGQRHSLVLTKSGEVYSFGHNYYGALALGHNNDCSSPQLVKYFVNLGIKVTRVVAGGYHSLFLTDRGLYSSGYSVTGELGIGTTENSPFPKPVSFFNSMKILDISVGSQHTLVTCDDGCLYVFGYSKFGQAGLGNLNSQLTPKCIEFFRGKPIQAVFGGYRHTMVLTGVYRPRQTPLRRAMLKLLHRGMFADGTVIIGGGKFELHRAILRVRCEPLARALNLPLLHQTSSKPTSHETDSCSPMQRFVLNKVSSAAFMIVMEYIYAEQLPPFHTDVSVLAEVLAVAIHFGLPELECSVYVILAQLITSTNVLHLLSLAIELELEPLKAYTLRYIAYHKNKFPTQQLRALMKDKFDSEIIWQIMALMDEPSPPTFPALEKFLKSQHNKTQVAEDSSLMDTSSDTKSSGSRLLAHDLVRLLDEGIDMDTEIAVGGEILRGHRAILAARNAWFELAMSVRMREAVTGVINIPGANEPHGMRTSALKALLRYLYTAQFQHITDASVCRYYG
jgi:alpha-tubulin suppressor-like RCC1 family protein